MEKLKSQSHGQAELTHRARLAKDSRIRKFRSAGRKYLCLLQTAVPIMLRDNNPNLTDSIAEDMRIIGQRG